MTIGGVACDVTSASNTSIDCDVGPGAAGNRSMIVHVEGKGSAAYPNGKFNAKYMRILSNG